MNQGDALAAWRLKQGLSQAQAAARIGVTQGAWGAWETGSKTPDADNRTDIEALTDGVVLASAWPRRKKGKLRRVSRRPSPSVPPKAA